MNTCWRTCVPWHHAPRKAIGKRMDTVGDPELQLFVSFFRQSLLMLFCLELPALVCLLPPLNKVIGMSLSHNLY